jgi:hypothetical protein
MEDLDLAEIDMAQELQGLWSQIMREWAETSRNPARFGRLAWDYAPSLGQAHYALRNSRYATGLDRPTTLQISRRHGALIAGIIASERATPGGCHAGQGQVRSLRASGRAVAGTCHRRDLVRPGVRLPPCWDS